MTEEFFQTTSLDVPSSEFEQWRKLAYQMQPSEGPGSGGFKQDQIDPKTANNDAQWLRRFNITLYKPGAGTTSAKQKTFGQGTTPGLDLSNLRCQFTVTKTTNATPNILFARIYNLAPMTMAKVIEMTRVQVSAGYWFSNYGLIFDGRVVQFRRGKESPVDTYLEIHAGDGDQMFNGATLFDIVQSGKPEYDKIKKAYGEMQKSSAEFSVAASGAELSQRTLPRTQVLVGPVKNAIREFVTAHDANGYMDNNAYIMMARAGYRPGTKVILSPKTGLVGMPEVTPQGIQARCLLNPRLLLGGLVEIKSTILSGVPFEPGTAAKTDQNGNVIDSGEPTGGIKLSVAMYGQQMETAWTSPTGEYKILLMKITGDTRGQPWYNDITCVAMENGHMKTENNPSTALKRASPQVYQKQASTGPTTDQIVRAGAT